METLQTIEQYIKENPLQSDKKIAKHLNIDRRRIKEIKAYLEQKKVNPQLAITPFMRGLQMRSFLANQQNKIRRLLDYPFLSGNLTYLNLFLLAIFIRLLYIIFLNKHPMLSVPLLDAENYVNWAGRILKEGPVGEKIFFAEPLYAYLLAFFLLISSHGQAIMISFQNILGSLLPIVVAKLGERLFNRPVGVLAALTTAIYGPFIFYENLLLKTSLESFFLTLFILVFLRVFSSTRQWQYVASGIFLGLIVTLKGNVLVVLPLVLYVIFRLTLWPQKTKMFLAVLFTTGFILAISPVTLRNYIVGKDFVPTNYSIGMFIYQGNWWDADGSLLQPPFSRPVPKYEETDFYKMAEAYVGKPLKPSQVSQFWITKTLSEISQNLFRWISLLGKKFLLLVSRVELSDNYDYALYQKFIPIIGVLPDFWPVASLGVTGFVLLLFSQDLRLALGRRLEQGKNPVGNNGISPGAYWVLDKEKKLILGLLTAYGLFMLSGSLNSRYRQPMIPFLIILSMVTIWYFFIKLKSKEYGRIVMVLIISAFFFFLTSIHLENFDFMTNANFYNNLGSYYLDRKDDVKAEMYFKKAIEVDKKYAWAYGNLFTLYLRHGEFSLAKENLEEQIKLRPDDLGGYYSLKLFNELKEKPIEFIQNRLEVEEQKSQQEKGNRYDPYFYEYMRYLKQGNYQKAQDYLEKSREKFADPENTLLNLASLKKSLGDKAAAKEILAKIIQKNPDFVAAKYNLANIYWQEKNYTEAARLLIDVYNIVPEFGDGEAWFYLAGSLINNKQYNAALPIIQGFIKRYENDPAKKKQVETFRSRLVPTTNRMSNPQY